MKITYFIAMLASLLLLSCNSEPSLQKYYVENAGKKDFVSLDISPSIINVDKAKLSEEQKNALESFDKMNILAFKLDEKNKAKYQEESQKLTKILKGEDYQQLMKIGEGKDAASISFVGDEDNIDEFILFAKREENGFAVVRILGNDMNPNNIMNMLSVLKSANIDMEQLKPLEGLMKK
ncbi:DUF4252 domain-containing protein [Flavobacterium sp. IMCC34852]|uniref:DUF4252 domain-containing protein n=1 Tax=Flavobacterium rivulicola TaxID=2732161 RepID=A0A7Y3R8C9_9FLAO|nr:DUF4252 domain-containing protein [Flavobacterium sp. IMCC34852]NNT71784.1 DUF4252 domain-containing protein [Flavobacterium sp. IMCC34852]